MQLLPDWRKVLKKAWSTRLIAVAGLLSGIEVILPYFSEAIPRGVFSILSVVVAMAAMYARIVVQKGVTNDQAN